MKHRATDARSLPQRSDSGRSFSSRYIPEPSRTAVSLSQDYADAMTGNPPSRLWAIYAVPTVIAGAAIGWAIALPKWTCLSGSDNSGCGDNIYVKWTIALSGLVLALIALGLIVVLHRVRRRRALA